MAPNTAKAKVSQAIHRVNVSLAASCLAPASFSRRIISTVAPCPLRPCWASSASSLSVSRDQSFAIINFRSHHSAISLDTLILPNHYSPSSSRSRHGTPKFKRPRRCRNTNGDLEMIMSQHEHRPQSTVLKPLATTSQKLPPNTRKTPTSRPTPQMSDAHDSVLR